MHAKLVELYDSLDLTSDKVLETTSEDRTMTEIWGWNFPPLTRHDLSDFAMDIAERISSKNIEEITEDNSSSIDAMLRRLDVLRVQTVPYLFNGNGNAAVPCYMALMTSISSSLYSMFEWEVPNPDTVPNALARKLRAMSARLEAIAPDMEAIEEKIQRITQASDAAESLPVDLADLEDARKKVSKAAEQAAILLADITSKSKEAPLLIEALKLSDDTAKRLVLNCEDAYRITTTKGLSAAFQSRARSLSLSVWAWVLLLLISLAVGAFIGYHRVISITTAMGSGNVPTGVLWLQFALSTLSVGAPLWFAWIATKQVGQRFRLAEDYAYKATIAKAYEGYRREAARIDPEMEKHLFSSALERLDEAPLRLVEAETHGGPWSEFLNSKAVEKAFDLYPDLRDQAIGIARQAVGRLSPQRPTASRETSPQADE